MKKTASRKGEEREAAKVQGGDTLKACRTTPRKGGHDVVLV